MKKFVVALADVVNTGLLSRWREGIISNLPNSKLCEIFLIKSNTGATWYFWEDTSDSKLHGSILPTGADWLRQNAGKVDAWGAYGVRFPHCFRKGMIRTIVANETIVRVKQQGSCTFWVVLLQPLCRFYIAVTPKRKIGISADKGSSLRQRRRAPWGQLGMMCGIILWSVVAFYACKRLNVCRKHGGVNQWKKYWATDWFFSEHCPYSHFLPTNRVIAKAGQFF